MNVIQESQGQRGDIPSGQKRCERREKGEGTSLCLSRVNSGKDIEKRRQEIDPYFASPTLYCALMRPS